MRSLASVKKRMLANPKVKAEYDALAPEFALARELIAARANLKVPSVLPRQGWQSE